MNFTISNCFLLFVCIPLFSGILGLKIPKIPKFPRIPKIPKVAVKLGAVGISGGGAVVLANEIKKALEEVEEEAGTPEFQEATDILFPLKFNFKDESFSITKGEFTVKNFFDKITSMNNQVTMNAICHSAKNGNLNKIRNGKGGITSLLIVGAKADGKEIVLLNCF